VVVEVYTPGGNWSSYPPHKHDVHVVDAAGKLVQADLDETYYYKIDRPEGYAIQRVYTDADSPLQQAGYPIDAAVIARNDDVVLIPEGYHPVSSPVGYTTYYLNVLAGSAQSLAAVDDPEFAWVKGTYQSSTRACRSTKWTPARSVRDRDAYTFQKVLSCLEGCDMSCLEGCDKKR
jgi:5-deoxy-glucuronate isomerase